MRRIFGSVAALAAGLAIFASSALALSPPQTFNMSKTSEVTNYFSGWNASLSSVVPSPPSSAGGNVAQATRTGGSVYSIGTFSSLFPNWGNSHACMSVWVKAGSASSVGKTSRAFIRERTSGGTLVGQNSVSYTLTNSWVEVFVYRSGIGSTNKLDFYVDLTDSTSGSYFQIDGMHVEGSPFPEPPGSCGP